MSATGTTSTDGDVRLARGATSEDWVAQSADTIERVVVAVRSKTTGPLEMVARVVVYGVLAAILGLAVAVLGAITLVRVLDILLPWEVWFVYAVLGGILTPLGLLLWRKRTPKDQ